MMPIRWRWFSPDGNLYDSYTHQIPKPGSPWEWYDLYAYIPIAGYDAAGMPGSWHVDVLLDGQKILSEQFTLAGSGGAAQGEYPCLSGIWYMGGPYSFGMLARSFRTAGL